MFVEVTREKLEEKGSLLSPILNRVKHGICIVNLSLMPTNPILTTLKNITTRKSF